MNDQPGYWDPLPAARASPGTKVPWAGTLTVLAPVETYLVDLRAHLRGYVFWLEEGRPPFGSETLPALGPRVQAEAR